MIDDVLVVGGGVVGMAIADALADESLRVRVLEGEEVGSGASGAAAGMLAPISEAHEDGPLLRLGLESLSRFESLCARLKDDTGVDAELEQSGVWCLAANEAEARALRERIDLLRAVLAPDGEESSEFPLEWLDSTALRDARPCLAPWVQGAFVSTLECHLRPPLLVRALAASARGRGAEIESGVRAQRLVTSGGRVVGVESSAGLRRAAHVVVAAGAWTPELLEGSAGVGGLPIEPVRGQLVLLEGPLPPLREILWAEGVYLVPKRDGSWIVGATEERVGFDRRTTAEGVSTLLARARAVIPATSGAAFGRAWAGLRPVSPDGLPLVGSVPESEGLLVAAGHGRNGVLLAPITAERVRDEVLGKRVPPEDDPLRVNRFASLSSRGGRR